MSQPPIEVLPAKVAPAVIAYLVSGGLIVWLCQLVSQAFRSEAESRRQEYYDNYYYGGPRYYGPGYGYYGGPRYYYDPY